MSTGLEEGKGCDPRILYLASLSYTCSGHDKQDILKGARKTFQVFREKPLRMFSNYEMNQIKSLRGGVKVRTHWWGALKPVHTETSNLILKLETTIEAI